VPNILSVVTFLPLVGAAAIAVLRWLARPDDKGVIDNQARWFALWTTLATFAVSIVLVVRFDRSQAGFQFLEVVPWFSGATYRMGVDGISVLFVLLNAFLFPLCIIAAWKSVKQRVIEYMIAFLVLETLITGVFTSLDLFLFYTFFEGSLVPMFLIIGIWGGKNRIYAAYKFFLYTLLGSILMLGAMFYLVGTLHTTSIPELMQLVPQKIDPTTQILLFLAFTASFAVKLPMWPVHTWLPDAHVEAPTEGSVILAGILLKLGGYGFLRFDMPMFPQAFHALTPVMFALAVIAIIYTALVAFRQLDIKKLIAYSSVAHMGFVTLGIFSGNVWGVQGAIFQMLSHGVISAALFLCVGVVYERMHTREIAFYGGLAKRMPWYAATFMVFSMGNVGLPGTSGFIGEILPMVGSYTVATWAVLLAASGAIFSAVYQLNLYRRVVFGELVNPELFSIADLDWREVLVFVPLIVLAIWLGFYPAAVFQFTQASAHALVATYQSAIGR
jgi:NADH-quinone oxidoreductase subunit M